MRFHKYQGTGNDFVLFDGRQQLTQFSEKEIAKLCDRHFGIGADGLIILKDHRQYDFEMIYFNSDGRRSSMCGNGGRCIARFAADLGLGKAFNFLAIDGAHRATVEGHSVHLQMKSEIDLPRQEEGGWFVDTGSPHYCRWLENDFPADFVTQAREIRCSPVYREKGVNVNFLRWEQERVMMRTYERGVENETLSCGTGVTAAALVAYASGLTKNQQVQVNTEGGTLSVKFDKPEDRFHNIWLSGAAEKVFEGVI